MKDCDEMFKNIVIPGVTVKSRPYLNGMEPLSELEQPINQFIQSKYVPFSRETQSQKGFYTWLSSPKTLHNQRKLNNVAVITPTQHQT